MIPLEIVDILLQFSGIENLESCHKFSYTLLIFSLKYSNFSNSVFSLPNTHKNFLNSTGSNSM